MFLVNRLIGFPSRFKLKHDLEHLSAIPKIIPMSEYVTTIYIFFLKIKIKIFGVLKINS
jgi:hypothetical protein